MQNLIPKELVFEDEGRQKLKKGIVTISKAVKSTLGARGKTVLIESPEHTHGITVTKDGVTVAKSIELIDPVENLAVRMMKQAAERTALQAGDGTTTAIVLAEALITRGQELLTSDVNSTEVLRELVDLTGEVLKGVEGNKKRLSQKRLEDVAIISANNDAKIGGIIADVYRKVGKDGVVTIEKSETSETYFETTDGIKIDRGYSNPLFINDRKNDECVYEDAYVLVCDTEISNILQIEKVLKPIIQAGAPLVIIAPCSTNVNNTLAANVIKKGMKFVAIDPPNFGYKQHEIMQDIAISVGAKYFSEKTGDDLSLIEESDLGFVKKVVASHDSTVLVRDDEAVDDEALNKRIEEITFAATDKRGTPEEEFLNTRLASLTGGIGVIHVGGNTDLEQKELYDRIDDAVNAVKSALEEGIVAGGGIALFHESMKILTDGDRNSIAELIMAHALRAPMNQILENGGINGDEISREDYLTDPHFGYDVKNNEYGNMFDMGIIDPMKVTRCALQNAVSVAVTVLSTNAIVTMARAQ